MDNRFLGELSTDVYGLTVNEMRLAHFGTTAAEGVAADADGIHAAIASKTTAQTVTTGISNPPYPRNITITIGGTTGDVKAGNIVVYGTNIAGKEISETFTLTDDDTAVDAGTKAFKTVTSIVIPAQDGTGATFKFGFGELMGLPFILKGKPLVFVLDDGVLATTPAITADDDELEKNVIDMYGSLDGSAYEIFIAI
jgi:hypothetical protein